MLFESYHFIELIPRTTLCGMLHRHQLGLAAGENQAGIIVRPFSKEVPATPAFVVEHPRAQDRKIVMTPNKHQHTLRAFFRRGELIGPGVRWPSPPDPHVVIDMELTRWQALYLLLCCGFEAYRQYQDRLDGIVMEPVCQT